MIEIKNEEERVILAGVDSGNGQGIEESLGELSLLARTAGAVPI